MTVALNPSSNQATAEIVGVLVMWLIIKANHPFSHRSIFLMHNTRMPISHLWHGPA